MPVVKCKKVHLLLRASERNKLWDEVKPSIVKSDGDVIFVDTDHPAFPKAPPKPYQKLVPKALPPKSHPMPWEVRGPLMWRELHSKKKADKQWMDAFTRKIPCGQCKNHWAKLVKSSPPPYGDDAAFYEWTVWAHNEVNQRLGKPIWTATESPTSSTPHPEHLGTTSPSLAEVDRRKDRSQKDSGNRGDTSSHFAVS